MAKALPLPPSLWAATARKARATPPLDASRKADVAIVGAGYSGLAAALQLAEAGVSVVVLEAGEPGWGASGRNGGQVIPGLKYDPDEIVGMLGAERGQRLIEFAGGTADVVFDLIEKHRMDVPLNRSGWIQGAHTAAAVDLVKSRVAQWSRLGASVQYLDKPDIDHLLGTSKYRGGWLDRRGGAIQPLSYARGLATAALAAGARIHG